MRRLVELESQHVNVLPKSCGTLSLVTQPDLRNKKPVQDYRQEVGRLESRGANREAESTAGTRFLTWVRARAAKDGGTNPGRTANKARAQLRAVVSWAWENDLIDTPPRFPKPVPQRDVAGPTTCPLAIQCPLPIHTHPHDGGCIREGVHRHFVRDARRGPNRSPGARSFSSFRFAAAGQSGPGDRRSQSPARCCLPHLRAGIPRNDYPDPACCLDRRTTEQ